MYKIHNKIRFIIAVVYILLAFAKLWTITQPFNNGLDRPDFLFSFLTLRQLLMVGALGELALGTIVFLNKNNWLSWCCVAGFSTALLLYRAVNLHYLGLAPCSCMGILTNLLHISMRTESILTLSFLLVVVPLSWFFVISGAMTSKSVSNR